MEPGLVQHGVRGNSRQSIISTIHTIVHTDQVRTSNWPVLILLARNDNDDVLLHILTLWFIQKTIQSTILISIMFPYVSSNWQPVTLSIIPASSVSHGLLPVWSYPASFLKETVKHLGWFGHLPKSLYWMQSREQCRCCYMTLIETWKCSTLIFRCFVYHECTQISVYEVIFLPH